MICNGDVFVEFLQILKTRNDGGSGDLNLDNMGKDNTLSGNLTGILPKRRVSFCHTNQVKYVIIILPII